MFFFVLRRLLVSIPLLIVSTLLVFWLVTISGDALAQFRNRPGPNGDQILAQARQRLQLDVPFIERYWEWLKGVVRLDFGTKANGQQVYPILKDSMITTMRLVLLATVLSIVIGLVIGIISAVRQYSIFDYGTTFASFLFFSLPVFWLAVLLKQFGAIELNNYLVSPTVSVSAAIVVGLIVGGLAGALTGGSWRRRLPVFGVAAAAAVALILIADATDWITNPGISAPVLAVFAAGAGVLSAMTFAPLSKSKVLIAGVASALVGFGASLLFDSWLEEPSWWMLLQLLGMSLAVGVVIGLAVGGFDRAVAARAGVMATVLVGMLVMFDRFISAWTPGRTIATVGPQTPNLSGTFWERMVDYASHQVLPSLALALIGLATFARFTRASMLETMNSDYVRTARAKGLPATQVVLRHGFRTALIPVMTIITLSFATVIEGAVITENVFSWRGMGTLFVNGLREVDPYPVMAFLVVVSVVIIVMNAITDTLYAYLDPRIRSE